MILGLLDLQKQGLQLSLHTTHAVMDLWFQKVLAVVCWCSTSLGKSVLPLQQLWGSQVLIQYTGTYASPELGGPSWGPQYLHCWLRHSVATSLRDQPSSDLQAGLSETAQQLPCGTLHHFTALRLPKASQPPQRYLLDCYTGVYASPELGGPSRGPQ